jgi:peptide/nickel transport system permease protein
VTKYIIRRLIYLVPVVFGVSLITFLLMRVVPGDVAVVALGTNATEESLADFRHAYGLDEPLFDYRPPFGQYGEWIGGFFKGDFGKSYFSRSPVRDELAHRLPVTLQLAIMSLFITLVPAIPAGVIAAVRPNSPIDLVTRTAAVLGLSIPVFWLGTLFILLPAIWFNWTPPFGRVSFFDDPFKNLQQFTLPALAMSIPSMAGIVRLVRSSVLEVLRQDYVRTARSKGLRETIVIWRHVLKNGLIPVVTVVGMALGALLGGAVIIESIFALPGVGLFGLQAIMGRDYLAVQSLVMLGAFLVVIMNLVTDISYVWFDPRIRYT